MQAKGREHGVLTTAVDTLGARQVDEIELAPSSHSANIFRDHDGALLGCERGYECDPSGRG